MSLGKSDTAKWQKMIALIYDLMYKFDWCVCGGFFLANSK